MNKIVENIKIVAEERNGLKIACIASKKIIINDAEDALELIANCWYNGFDSVIISSENITPEFFDLKTGIAGEILQKFTTYDLRFAVTGDFSEVESKSLRDFIRESNRNGRILFVSSAEDALNRLSEIR